MAAIVLQGPGLAQCTVFSSALPSRLGAEGQ